MRKLQKSEAGFGDSAAEAGARGGQSGEAACGLSKCCRQRLQHLHVLPEEERGTCSMFHEAVPAWGLAGWALTRRRPGLRSSSQSEARHILCSGQPSRVEQPDESIQQIGGRNIQNVHEALSDYILLCNGSDCKLHWKG